MRDRRYGGFLRRALAFGIDKAILHLCALFLFAVGLLALGLVGSISLDVLDEAPERLWMFAILHGTASLFASLLYFTWFHGSVGQTPGKMLLGLKVIRASGESLSFGFAFLRWVGYLVSSSLLGLGFLWVLFDSRRQGWHDKIADTLVIRVGRKASEEKNAEEAGGLREAASPFPEKGLDKGGDIG
ncbi:MAG: RDD family protein [Deltaproteobacteria bacterium]|nr:RDD family protein [Deltaproteobacteria bacterium]